MFRYSGFALTIASEFELPELSAAEGEPDVTIRRGTVIMRGAKATLDDECAFNTLAARFHIRHGSEIVVDPLPGVDAGTLRVVLLGRIMAFLLRQRGWLSLHASGVLIEGQAVLFVGASGAGKSTTAAAFHARGHMVVTDDVGAVRVIDRQCTVLPAWPRLRLLDDSRAVITGLERRVEFQIDKHTVDLDHPEFRGRLPVKRIYTLGYGPEHRLESIGPAQKVATLSTNSFVKRRMMTAEALALHVSDCVAVAGFTPMYRLVRPESLEALPAMVRFVERDLEKNPDA